MVAQCSVKQIIMDYTFIKSKRPDNCCGCEACSYVCPKHIIMMQEDHEGFVYPVVTDETKCISCGGCEKICPVTNPTITDDSIKSFCSGHLCSDDDIRASASGGLATAISRSFIERFGGVVYGVAYSVDCQLICYEKASTIQDLERFRGSKYAQARKSNDGSSLFMGGKVYKSVLRDLKQGVPVLFIGLPCEIAALTNITKHRFENLFTIELVCHGPTSQKVHRDFLKELEEENGSTISSFSVRFKNFGWKPYYIKAVFADNTVSDYLTTFHESAYGIAFRYLKRPSCAKCNFKLGNSSAGLQADITVGDFHYAGPSLEAWNKWGSSVGYIHSDKGIQLVKLAEESFDFYETNPIYALKSSYALAHAVKSHINRGLFSKRFVTLGLNLASSHYTVKAIDRYLNVKHHFFRSLVILRNMLRKCL